jgi:hypothetical protein
LKKNNIELKSLNNILTLHNALLLKENKEVIAAYLKIELRLNKLDPEGTKHE